MATNNPVVILTKGPLKATSLDVVTAKQTSRAQESPFANWQEELSCVDRIAVVLGIADAYRATKMDDLECRAQATKDETRIHSASLSRDEYDIEIDHLVAAIRNRAYKIKPPATVEISGSTVRMSDVPETKLSATYPRCKLIGEGASSHVYLVQPTNAADHMETTPVQTLYNKHAFNDDDDPRTIAKQDVILANYHAEHPPTAKVVKAVHIIPPSPHSAFRERLTLCRDLIHKSPHVIDLIEAFPSTNPDYGWGLVLPYYPLTLEDLLRRDGGMHALKRNQIACLFYGIFSGLRMVHSYGIIHRDIKPSAIMLATPRGPAVISDFGTAYIPDHPFDGEEDDTKILDVGTGPYRAPEALFGLHDYDTKLDIWAAGCMLAECVRTPHTTLFECPPGHEDGSQLMLIKSIFSTWGLPTKETWPKVEKDARVKPWDMWAPLDPKPMSELFPDQAEDLPVVDLIRQTVRYDESKRLSALEARSHDFFKAFRGLDDRLLSMETLRI